MVLLLLHDAAHVGRSRSTRLLRVLLALVLASDSPCLRVANAMRRRSKHAPTTTTIGVVLGRRLEVRIVVLRMRMLVHLLSLLLLVRSHHHVRARRRAFSSTLRPRRHDLLASSHRLLRVMQLRRLLADRRRGFPFIVRRRHRRPPVHIASRGAHLVRRRVRWLLLIDTAELGQESLNR